MDTNPVSLRRHLHAHFPGLTDFRGLQLRIIQNVLRGHHTIMHSATGTGKSLVYLFLASYCKKSMIVISPLRFLCFDQLRNAHQKFGLDAVFIGPYHGRVAEPNTDQDTASNFAILDQCLGGRTVILLVSPEFFALHTARFMRLMRLNKVAALVVDECHVLAHWAPWRPGCEKLLQILATQCRNVLTPHVFLSATLTRDHIQTIRNAYFPSIIHRFGGISARTNIFIRILRGTSMTADIVKVLEVGEPTIIYLSTKKSIDSLSVALSELGIPHAVYYRGVPRQEFYLQLFTENCVNIIIATTALGVGYDKPDVRHVIHYGVQTNLVDYYQEIGRSIRMAVPGRSICYGGAPVFIDRLSRFERPIRSIEAGSLHERIHVEARKRYFQRKNGRSHHYLHRTVSGSRTLGNFMRIRRGRHGADNNIKRSASI